jgi:hypothetical protein
LVPATTSPQSPGKKIWISLSADTAENGARRRGARIGRTHHRPHDLPRVVGAFDDHRHDRPARHETHEVGVERLAFVLGVVACERRLVERAQLHGGNSEAPALESRDDFTDEPALHRVGLQQHQGSAG